MLGIKELQQKKEVRNCEDSDPFPPGLMNILSLSKFSIA